jgi:ADP-ribosylglycohydrolase
MSAIELGRESFRDKVLGCWLGKSIGGTLGAPHEGKRYALALEFYDPLPKEAAPNDDLDLQLVWLACLEDRGIDPSVAELAEYWAKYAAPYPWNEYGFFMRNYTRGLRPPVAGAFENYFVDEMGSPIRSEIWAVLHPADPEAAARMAWKDSALDHTSGEGTYGEMFWAAAESAAFVESDPVTLIRIGLEMIPLGSHIARSIREALYCFEHGIALGDARERIASRFGHMQPCNAVPNHGFTVLGWLYGRDFGDKLLKAVNCGYDTDCTGATLGSMLGILGGASAIPERWIAPVGRGIVLHPFTRLPTAPRTIDELADRSIALAEKAALASGRRGFSHTTRLPEGLLGRLFRNAEARAVLASDTAAGTELVGGREIRFHYNGEPVLRPGIARTVAVSIDGAFDERVALEAPDGWTQRSLGAARFELACSGDIAPRNSLVVRLPNGERVPFTVLGPAEAGGFPAGDNVERCTRCQARKDACIC